MMPGMAVPRIISAKARVAGQTDVEPRCRAWHEWMPVRFQPGHDRIWRRFQFADLVDLMMLDTRLRGRDLQLDSSRFLEQNSPDFSGLMRAIDSA